MRNEFLDFKSRLQYLIDNHIPTIKNAHALAKDMYDKEIIEYPINCKNKKERHNYTERTINIHLGISSAEKISGLWLKRYCDYFKCSADFLLGYIDMPNHIQTDIKKETGLSETAIEYLHEKAKSNSHIDILNILLRPGNFDNALWHLHKYKDAVCLYEGLSQTRRERKEKIIAECIQKDGDLASYNYPYNDSLDTSIHDAEIKMDVEELRIDQNFKFIIQEIARISREEAIGVN